MNNKYQKNGVFALSEKISYAILLFLLLVRLADQRLPWMFGSSTPQWYAGIIYVLTTTIVWLNRHRLAALNIDRPFVAAWLLSGILYVVYLIPSVGIFVGITVGLIYWAYITNQLVFKNPVPSPRGTGILIFLTILFAVAPVLFFQPAELKTALSVQVFVTAFREILITQLASIIFEEVLFRGALWAYLRSLGLSEQAALFIQAILFWVSHHKYLSLSNPYFFWVALPIITVLLSLMTWRSKSLTPSTISHFLFNFISHLLLTIY